MASRWLALVPVLMVPFAACDSESEAPAPSVSNAGAAGAAGSAGAAGAATDAGEDADAVEVCLEAPGETGEPPAPDPGTPVPGPTLDCGTPSFDASLSRYPYLQKIDQTSALVVWTQGVGASGNAKIRVAESLAGPWTEHPVTSERFDVARTGTAEDYDQYVASISGLEPGRAYCYEIVDGGTTLASGLRFDTAWDGDTRPVRILTFGDSGSGNDDQKAIRDQFQQHDFDVFLHLGDMAYGDGTFTEFEQNHFDIYRYFLHRVPWYPTLGNHEYKTDRGQPALDLMYVWENAWRAEEKERYYSFDYGNIHFVSLDTNSEMVIPIQLDFNASQTDDMMDWVEDDLAKTDKPWKIVFMHHPPFSSSDRGTNAPVVTTVLPALQDGKVDLVLVGHDHHYERTHPIRGDCGEVPGGINAIPYIINGAGGAGAREASGDWFTAAVNPLTHAFTKLEVHGCRLTGVTIGKDGAELDRFEMNGCDN